MENVNEVSLGGKVFAIEENASDLLEEYLKDVAKHLTSDEDIKSAVVLEIEKKIAKRLDTIQTNPRKAITETHVTTTLAKMGPAKAVGDIHDVIHRIISHHKHTESAKKEESSSPRGFVAAHQFIGFLLLSISSLSLIFITLEIFSLDIKTASPAIRLPFDAFRGDYQIPTMVMLYLLSAIPLILLILLGASILLRRNLFSQIVAWFLITVWVLLVVISTLGASQIITKADLTQPYHATPIQALFVK
ncbi:MAG: hypothetical protein COU10_00415 [Candidatus Harrisonbacteria bacterium CG10_big_fil_rev_8_21_14_0_10_45_28]|uniref:PspC-related transmembrane region domain-containing protein n=1 Tax=Candidatus Harrisonbacteria bacterium CG10_big_fil_rev_8_21_14_0_10_45_28 TaxID=1974586 RepID=A0A2H0UP82_9BACT|nr:MAG: hypothetical protein COU10_00415 [Candidatus Harrisonbacteria bacterium CG10_big_fil_rev_8_21_14_0_10_45_28]